jgi:hypothetical protein
MLVSNHFKLTVQNKGIIHIYKVDFGALENMFHSEAIRNARRAITAILGNFISCGDYIFAMTLLDETEPLCIESAAKGQLCELNINLKMSFNLDQSRQMQSDMAVKVLDFLNTLIKSVLRAQDFK